MMLTMVVGAVLFAGLLTLLLFILPNPSAASVLLDEVTQQERHVEGTGRPVWRSAVSADFLAKPFAAFRRFFSPTPDPALVRRLMLAGYRKPAHPDIFLGARLALPAVLGLSVALLVSNNTFFFFILTLGLAFFLPDFWLSHAINKRREKIRLSLPDALDLLSSFHTD